MSKVILITGVSSGFGKETSALLAAKGHIVYGTVRKECEVHPSVKVLKMDLLDPVSIKEAVDTVIKNEGRIDVLVNNAGMHLGGPIEEAPADLFKRQMETNVNGLVFMLQSVLPYMRKQNYGTIINFSSIGGLMGLPFQPFYSASKFAIEGLSESLRMEISQFNIKVVVINPGDFHTSNTANRINIVVKDGPYDKQFEISRAKYENDENNGGKPIMLAKKLVKIIECKKPHNRYIISTFEQKLSVYLKKILPVGTFSKIIASYYNIK